MTPVSQIDEAEEKNPKKNYDCNLSMKFIKFKGTLNFVNEAYYFRFNLTRIQRIF
jgi:hypothetical protein